MSCIYIEHYRLQQAGCAVSPAHRPWWGLRWFGLQHAILWFRPRVMNLLERFWGDDGISVLNSMPQHFELLSQYSRYILSCYCVTCLCDYRLLTYHILDIWRQQKSKKVGNEKEKCRVGIMNLWLITLAMKPNCVVAKLDDLFIMYDLQYNFAQEY